jgi:hypothetical protein
MSAVTTKHPSYDKAALKWAKLRDCIEGEDEIHDEGEKYLPALSPRQKPASYEAYKSRARFWNATKRTLAGWRGAVFRRPPVETVPEDIKPLLADITLSAVPFPDFCGQTLDEVLSSGRCGILVDHQKSTEGRPYLTLFLAEEIINWATTIEDGVHKLSLVVLAYCVQRQSADGFGVEEVTEIRELRMKDGVYIQRIWREEGEKENRKWGYEEIIPKARAQSLDAIPFVFIGPESLSPKIQASPLYEIATVNVHHYKRSADLCHALHYVALPIYYSINEEIDENAGPVEMGPGTMQQFQGENCQVGIMEPAGSGLDAVRQDMLDMKDEISSLGAAAITPPLRMAESAQALENKQNEQSAPLVKTVDVVSDGLTEALQWLVWWHGGDETTVKVRLNKAFANTRLSPQDIQALSAALQSGAITAEHYAFLLEQAESLPPDLDYKAYAEQLKQEKEQRRANLPPNLPPRPNDAPKESPLPA